MQLARSTEIHRERKNPKFAIGKRKAPRKKMGGVLFGPVHTGPPPCHDTRLQSGPNFLSVNPSLPSHTQILVIRTHDTHLWEKIGHNGLFGPLGFTDSSIRWLDLRPVLVPKPLASHYPRPPVASRSAMTAPLASCGHHDVSRRGHSTPTYMKTSWSNQPVSENSGAPQLPKKNWLRRIGETELAKKN